MAQSPGAALFHTTTTPLSPTAGIAPVASPGAALFHGATPATTAPAHHSGGLLGTIEKIGETAADAATLGTTSALGVKSGYLPSTASIVNPVLDKAASTTESIGTGLYKITNDAVNPNDNTVHAIGSLAHGHLGKAANQLGFNKQSYGQDPFTAAKFKADPLGSDVEQIGKQTESGLVHPLRNPVNTGLTWFTLASLGAGGAARLAYATRALSAAKIGETGDLVVAGSKAAKAAEAAGLPVEPLTTTERTALAGKALTPGYKVPTSLRVIRAPITDLVKPEGGAEGPAAAITTTKPVMLQASSNHLMRVYQAAHDAIIQHAIDNAGESPGAIARYGMGRVQKSIGEGVRVTANDRGTLERLLVQSGRKFDDGVSRKEGNLALFIRSANVDPGEMADFWEAHGQQSLADAARSIEAKGLLERVDGNIRVSDKFPKLQKAEGLLAKAQAVREAALLDHGLMNPEGLATRKRLVAETIGSEGARDETTGIRGGQGYTSLKTSKAAQPQTAFTQSRAQGVMSAVKGLAVGKEATGLGIAKGLVPDDTTLGTAQSLHEILRYVNTVEFRGRVAQLGSDVRRSNQDILVRDPSVAEQGVIPGSIEELLGRKQSTLDTLPTEEGQSIRAAIRARIEDEFPNPKEYSGKIGMRAPTGYKWVPKQLIPSELTRVATPRSGLAKVADTVNSAVTQATVYLKLGHFPTRFLTNFATNAVQGSAKDALLTPFGIGESAKIAEQLTETEKEELASVTGTHGYQALPHQGTNIVARGATRGANFWARHIDAPFRLNSILYELRQAGFNTAPLVRQALDHLRAPADSPLSLEDGMKVDQAVREANRASIMYDGLGNVEQRVIARVLWFYPWTKGAARFTFHTAASHPVKALALAQTGALGAAAQHGLLGPVPSFEQGLTPVGGSTSNPLTSNFSSYTPFSTLGQVAQMIEHPRNVDTGVASQANPEMTALVDLIRGKGYRQAAGDAVQPTPEMQILTALLHPPAATRMFGDRRSHSWARHRERRAVRAPPRARRCGCAAPNEPWRVEHLCSARAREVPRHPHLHAMNEQHHERKELDPTQQTRDWIDLKLASLRSEMRLLFVLSVAGNQLLTHIALNPVIGFVGTVAVAGAAALKIALLR